MKSILKLTLAASVAMMIATGCSKSNGSSSSDATPIPPSLTTGHALDGYLKGAQVFADCNKDLLFQSGSEPSTTTDDQGNFTLSVPNACKYANFITIGGFDIATQRPFLGSLMAGPGATTVSPLTTMVALDPSFSAKLEAMGVDYTVDFATDPVPADVLRLAMGFAQTINTLMATTQTSDSASAINSIVGPLVTSLSALSNTDLADSNKTAEALATESVAIVTAVAGSRDDVTFDGSPASIATLKSNIKQTVTIIAAKIPDGDVTVADADNNAIAAQVDTATTNIAVVVPAISFSVTGIKIGTIVGTGSNNNYTIANVPVNEANTTLEVTVVLENTVATKTYENISISAIVKDNASPRTATIVINNINIDANINTTEPILPQGQTLTVIVTGKDGTGSDFTAVSLTGNLDSILSVVGNVFTLDIAALQTKLQEYTAGSGHPLEDFNILGSYTASITTPGLPLNGNSVIADITVVP